MMELFRDIQLGSTYPSGKIEIFKMKQRLDKSSPLLQQVAFLVLKFKLALIRIILFCIIFFCIPFLPLKFENWFLTLRMLIAFSAFCSCAY